MKPLTYLLPQQAWLTDFNLTWPLVDWAEADGQQLDLKDVASQPKDIFYRTGTLALLQTLRGKKDTRCAIALPACSPKIANLAQTYFGITLLTADQAPSYDLSVKLGSELSANDLFLAVLEPLAHQFAKGGFVQPGPYDDDICWSSALFKQLSQDFAVLGWQEWATCCKRVQIKIEQRQTEMELKTWKELEALCKEAQAKIDLQFNLEGDH